MRHDKLIGLELLTELTATFAFIAVVVGTNGNPIVAGVALAIAIFFAGWFGGRANHLNPAISIGMIATGQVGMLRGIALMTVQVIAGILGVLFAVFVKSKL